MMHMDLNTRKPLVNTKYTEHFVLGSGKTTVAAKLSAIPVDTATGDKYSAITTAAGNDTQKGFAAVVTLESALGGTCSVKAYNYTDVVTIDTTLASSKSGDTITAKYPVMYSFAYPKYITKYECGQTFIRWILWSVLQGWDAAWARGNHKKFVYNSNSGGIINSSTGEVKVY